MFINDFFYVRQSFVERLYKRNLTLLSLGLSNDFIAIVDSFSDCSSIN